MSQAFREMSNVRDGHCAAAPTCEDFIKELHSVGDMNI